MKDATVQSGDDVFDRDLDPQPRRPARGNDVSHVPFQRLVVNPFLAVLLFVIVVALWNGAFVWRSPGLFQLGVGLGLVGILSGPVSLPRLRRGRLVSSATAATRASRWGRSTGSAENDADSAGPACRAQLWLWILLLAVGVFARALSRGSAS